MPAEDIQAWSTTAATNATADTGINWAEGQPRASVNNSARSMMAAHAKDRNLRNGSITTGGTANAQTFTSGVSYTTVPTGLTVRLKIGVTNTAATTLNMDGIGAVAIKDQAGLDIGANALLLGRYVDLLYNGTNWILLAAGASAAPFDALAYNGMQINGSMEVSQELGLTGAIVSGAFKYILDGFIVASIGSQVVASAQNSGGPPGFKNYIYIAPTTANASPAANSLCFFVQYIEGYRISRLGFGAAGASPITIGFWIRAFRAGNYSGAILNSVANRSYAFTFTVNASNTWEYKTVTIPGDTTGSWTSDNTIGLQVVISMMLGSNYQTAPNVWTAGAFYGATGIINGVASTSDLLSLTGFVVLPGSDAPSAARSPFIMRPYDQELVLCWRYFEVGITGLDAYAPAAGYASSVRPVFKKQKRGSPTITLTNLSNTNCSAVGNVADIQGDSFKSWRTSSGPGALSYGEVWYSDARL